eukprot:TRINITY_DN39398_c0_g1_i1.p1 TRINITY_DN39398_c0_g1~~TRINITY_DN39398_c0_g1_i1.p1  ORF type:complete len:407 (-),score=65.12 TRINITY_DN39398_c0_g1_i1:25-1206(-)
MRWTSGHTPGLLMPMQTRLVSRPDWLGVLLACLACTSSVFGEAPCAQRTGNLCGEACSSDFVENAEACVCHGGYKRCWVEQGFRGSGPAQPLVVELHPWYSSGQKFKDEYTEFNSVALAGGAAMVWPTGLHGLGTSTGFGYSWNAGSACCSPACTQEEDDVGFLRKLVENVKSRHAVVDMNRIYFTGFSNGCGLSQRMAAQASDITAAVACTGLMLLAEKSQEYRPTPVMVLMSSEDGLRDSDRYKWLNTGKNTAPNSDICASHAKWKEWNGCSGEDVKDRSNGSTRFQGSNCAAPVVLVDCIAGQKPHEPTLAYGEQTAGQLMWDFLQLYTLNSTRSSGINPALPFGKGSTSKSPAKLSSCERPTSMSRSTVLHMQSLVLYGVCSILCWGGL